MTGANQYIRLELAQGVGDFKVSGNQLMLAVPRATLIKVDDIEQESP
jgi:hypothetical protein